MRKPTRLPDKGAFGPTPEKLPPRLKSRRRPRLRLVGEGNPSNWHAANVTVMNFKYVLEVFTIDEWLAFPEDQRPRCPIVIPGIGLAMFRDPVSRIEPADIADIENQQLEEWGLYRPGRAMKDE